MRHYLCLKRVYFFIQTAVVVALVAFVTSCTKAPNSSLQTRQSLENPYSQPASMYLAQAKEQDSPEREDLKILAAGRLIYEGHWQQGRVILQQLKHLAFEQAQEKNLLLAKVDMMREQPQQAKAKLAKVDQIESLPAFYQAQYHEMLAQAYQKTHHPSESVSQRVRLNRLLTDHIAKENNLRALWLSLTTLPNAELSTLSVESEDGSELKGWMELALISRKNANRPEQIKEKLMYWQSQYPEHTGNTILNQQALSQNLLPPPKQIAVLLPLTGPLSGPGNAVRDGFMSAYEKSAQTDNMNVRFYNTDAGQAQALYTQAIADGADYVVGPLTKNEVNAVAKMSHPVPTLLLNDSSRMVGDGVYQFGLSPSIEAIQIASKARKSGHTKALVIAPQGQWGDDVLEAFRGQWQTEGGEVVDVFRFQNQEDFHQSIRAFLRVADSENRSKQVKQLLGRKVQATPRRRQDFDMIFLLAYPSKARQIMPLLRYYYAGNIPVYAPSTVYAGVSNPRKDKDLNGIIFCDMPWVFKHQNQYKNWPEQFNSYNRLFAMGMDSFQLSQQLNQLALFPAMGVRDQSGVLYLAPGQKIGRILSWGQFKSGIAKPLDVNV